MKQLLTLFNPIILILTLLLCTVSVFSYENPPSDTDNVENFLFALPDDQKATKLNQLAAEVVSKDPQKAINYSNRALKIALQKNYLTEIANAYSNIGLAYDYIGDYEIALENHVEAHRIREIQKDKVGMAQSLNNIGVIYFNIKAYHEAKEFYERALNLRIAIGDTNQIYKSLNNMGLVTFNVGEFSKSLEYYFEMLKIVESKTDSSEYANINNKIAMVYYALKMYDEALNFYQKAIELSSSLNNKAELARSLTNIGNIYFETNRFKEALTSYEKALIIRDESKDKKGIGILQNNIGMIHKQMGNYPKALDYCTRSIATRLEIADSSGVFHPLTTKAQIFILLKNYDDALNNLSLANEIANNLGDKKQLLIVYEIYHDLYREIGNYRTALDYYKLYSSTKDSLINEESNKRIAELKISYDVDKKEKENIMLRQQNESQRRINEIQKTSFILITFLIFVLLIMFYFRYKTNQRTNNLLRTKNQTISEQTEKLQEILKDLRENEKQLIESNATKDKFFTIIAHDLKNPLHAIVLSSDTIKTKFKMMTEQQHVDLISQINKAGLHLSNLLENLLFWSKAQSGAMKPERQMIDLSYLVAENVKLLSESAKNKGISIQFGNGGSAYAYADPNMINTVIRNLMSNAIKFTSKGGEVTLSTRINAEYCELKVKDTGVGISEEDLKKLFRIDVHYSTFGTSREKGTGLGLILCREFMEMNHGSIEAQSSIGKGTELTIKIPLKPSKPQSD
ncbi:MAG: tetratricopeptide repeat-containing sensor histidine kinase [Desulfobulbaceae bacterium]|nr:tetratricopeptide repeat-containing sensor histidine kinase [Desulfobulbaceae bacterium]